MNTLKPFFTLLVILLTVSLSAQRLPASWAISPDERKLTAGGENNAGFYHQYQVRDIRLEFTQADWWSQLNRNYASKTDLPATCWIDGVRYDGVGVRFKGNSSFRRNDTEKKSFQITLDYRVEDQEIDGYSTFNLNGGWLDTTAMREVLYNNVGRNYYMSLKTNHVNLRINGENWGLYQNVQQFDGDYIKDWFLSNDGTIWRAENINGGTPGAGLYGRGKSTLNYNGQDSMDYHRDYTLKRTEQVDPWAGLIAACDVLNNTPMPSLEEELTRVLDIDKTCWFLAHETVFADSDSYVNKGGDDYFTYYEPETGRIVPMEYDGNEVLLDRLLDMPLFHHINDRNFPLLHRMLRVPTIRQRYLAHVRVILADYFTPEFINPKIDAWADMIDTYVQDDSKKTYSYDQFKTAIAELKQAVINRKETLAGEPELRDIVSLEVNEVSHSVAGSRWQSPNVSEEVDVVARITGEVGTAAVWLRYGKGLTGPFSRTEMFDDGRHNDGAAGDGQYGGAIPPLDGEVYGRYYIEAIADDAAATVTFEPKGAEHNVYLYRIDNTSALAGEVVINEFMASNDTTQADQDGEYDDWIELYNNTGEDISLDGFHLSDDPDDFTKWSFPAGTVIAGNAYLIVWADGDLDQEGIHADFKLSAGGESVLLVDAGMGIVDSLTYGEQENDISFGRFPNGTGDFTALPPTFRAENKESVIAPPPQASPLRGDLVVNEFMAANEATRADQDGEFDDWIELYNNTDAAISLAGFSLTDDPGELTKWSFPAEATIDANDYLVIWADEDEEQAGLHADFKLAAGGEQLLIVDGDRRLVDSVGFPEQVTDISFGRFPNGTGDFREMTPTFNAENKDGIVSTGYEMLRGAELTLSPNPATGVLNIRLVQAYAADLLVRLLAANGQLQRTTLLPRGATSLSIDVAGFPAGLYLLTLQDGRATATHKVFIRR